MEKQKWVPRPINAERRKRHLAWRADFRRQQAETKEKIKALLGLAGISKTDFYYLCYAKNNRRGPRIDQIKRIGKLWVKYGFAEANNA